MTTPSHWLRAVVWCGVCAVLPQPCLAAETPSDPAPAQAAAVAAADGETPPKTTHFDEEILVTDSPSLTMASPEAARHELEVIAGGTTFVDAESYQEGRVSTLKDALEMAPGVFAQPRFGAEEARLSIRGSGLQRTFHGRGLKLLQDGVALNLADGGFDFQAVEPLAARYVEVFRGPNGLEHGSATLGGAINFLSRNGHEASPLQARLEGGDFGYLRAQASTGAVRGDLDYYATLAHFEQDGFRDHSRQNTQRLFANLGYRLNPSRETRFYLTAVRTDSELPGSLTKAQLGADASQAAAGNLALDQKRDFDLLRLANRTSLVLGERGQMDLSASYSYKHLDHPIFQVLDQLSHDVGLDLRYSGGGTWLGRSHRLVVGLAPVVGVLEDNRFRNVAGQRGARTAQADTRSTGVDLYAEDRVALSNRLSLSLGFVTSWAERDFEDQFLTDGDQTDNQTFSGFSPKLGLLWQASSGATFFANLARSFEPPSFGELVNVGGDGLLALEEQTSTSIEVGARGRRGKLSWDLVLYHAWLEDELLSLNDGAGNPLGTLNADRTVHAGAEVGFEVELLSTSGGIQLDLRQSYLWSHLRFDGDAVYGDNQLAGLPEHLLRADLTFRHPRGIYGGPNFEWVPSRTPVDHANSLFAEPYSIWGLRLGYRGERGLGFFVEGRNLGDRGYAATTGVIADARGRDSAQFLPGDGAAVFAGIDFRR